MAETEEAAPLLPPKSDVSEVSAIEDGLSGDAKIEKDKPQNAWGAMMNIFTGNFANPFSSENPENGTAGTCFLLVNTMIGSGILNQPEVFAKSGIFAACIIYLVTAYTTWLGLVLLVKAGEKSKCMDLSQLAGHCYGKVGHMFTDIAVATGCFGALLSYMTVVGGETTEMVSQQFDPSGEKWFSQVRFILPIVVACFCLPLCLTRVFGHFVFISVLSLCAIGGVMGLVLIKGPSEGIHTRSEPLVLFDLGGSIEELGSSVFAFGCAYACFHAYNSLGGKLQGSWERITGQAVTIGASMCFITGLIGYISFRSETQGDILDNFDGIDFYFFKILLVVHLILYIPLDFVVMRHSILKLYHHDATTVPTVPYALITVGLLGFTTFVVVQLYDSGLSEGEAFSYILDISGGLTGSYVGFILPAAAYLKVEQNNPKAVKLPARLLLLW
eukprot:CAMPEP_0113944880 /NCGR_PEP_ID=MMETSP1339-20121228/37509_1 /TAXON_ID=94617 /ORGANISM="Fibrocapsa japonica" /LENGTH=442 /DNA_ID=CAMNT_0000950223 /DNA_START=17 /DNA_END=1342 /DNA_ORIENTATION=- /assembly_acc=CAM_ASM_000762